MPFQREFRVCTQGTWLDTDRTSLAELHPAGATMISMDALYYWKNFEADLKAGRIGYFRSAADKLKELHDGFPDFIWVIKTPRGRKGQVQVLARLKWMDHPAAHVKVEPSSAYMHYAPDDPTSVYFVDSDSEAAITAVSDWIGRHFPGMLAANFQGTAGQVALRGGALKELVELANSFKRQPFRELAK